MANINAAYGTGGQAITITLASLANGAARQSAAVDNTTALYLDALVTVKAKTGASGVAATGSLAVYAYGTTDGGTTYTEGAGGTDAAITPVSPTNLRYVGTINAVAAATSYVGGPLSVAAAFGGTLPQKWGLVVQNNTGAALDATAGNFAVTYQGVYATAI